MLQTFPDFSLGFRREFPDFQRSIYLFPVFSSISRSVDTLTEVCLEKYVSEQTMGNTRTEVCAASNPLHAGHFDMRQVKMLQCRVTVEFSGFKVGLLSQLRGQRIWLAW